MGDRAIHCNPSVISWPRKSKVILDATRNTNDKDITHLTIDAGRRNFKKAGPAHGGSMSFEDFEHHKVGHQCEGRNEGGFVWAIVTSVVA